MSTEDKSGHQNYYQQLACSFISILQFSEINNELLHFLFQLLLLDVMIAGNICFEEKRFL